MLALDLAPNSLVGIVAFYAIVYLRVNQAAGQIDAILAAA